jgi:CRISPR-associated protein Csb1
MPVDFKVLEDEPRILIQAALKPVAGTRIQPTGFPDLGPATYDAPDDKGGTVPTLLVESAQSMANRLEAVCWDEATDDLASELMGLPFVKVKLAGIPGSTHTTYSILEFHRLNSPYIMNGVTDGGVAFADVLRPQLGLATASTKKATATKKRDDAPAEDAGSDKERDDVAGVVNLRKLAAVCFKYDPNSLVHGVFLEKIAGRLRHPRALSAFIEASGVGRADSGGVKFDRALPKPKVAGVDAKGGYGNVPFHRAEFTAKSITAFFSVDLAQIRGYGLGDDAGKLLIALALWKVRRFLDSNMRLRTACELELPEGEKSIQIKRPDRFTLPAAADLTKVVGDLIKKCKPLFAQPSVTELTWNKP